jgi:thioester reductase-like protein
MEELERDARLPESIRPCGPTVTQDPVEVLLTGATGFLGSFLLHELLTSTMAHVNCVVRADDERHAMGRIRAKMSSFGLWEDDFALRVSPVLGDMTKPRLALSDASLDELGERCDSIYHVAANVNFLFPYRVLRAANVGASLDVLRLACSRRQKPLHFVSTIGIFLSPDHAGRVIREDDPLDILPARANGYSQSKWVAEHLMMAARGVGIPVTIHRPGFVGWQKHSGVMNDKDFVTGMLQASLALGKAPDVSMTVDVAPVDYVVRAMTWLSLRSASAGKTYHLNNPQPWTWHEVVKAFRAEGMKLEWTSYDAWRAELAQRRDGGLHRFATMLPERLRDEGSIFVALEAPPTFDFETTTRDLAGSGITPGKLDGNLVRAYLRNPNSGARPPKSESLTRLVGAPLPISKAG